MKKAFFIVAAVLVTQCIFAQATAEYTKILASYEQWKAAQYRAGTYATPGNCKMEVVVKDGYKGPTAGIPKDISIYYSDINADGKLDALVTFNPVQCDGGNAMMNVKSRVLILSKGLSWTTDDKFINGIESKKDGWLSVSGVSGGTIFGTYYDYAADDPRCCPSVKRSFTIDFKTRKLTIDKD